MAGLTCCSPPQGFVAHGHTSGFVEDHMTMPAFLVSQDPARDLLAWWAGFGFFTFQAGGQALSLRLRGCLAWRAGFGLGVCAAKNLRKHARAALAGNTGFCGHAPFCDFFIAHPLPQSLQGVAGAPLNTEYRRLNTEYRSPKTERPKAQTPKCSKPVAQQEWRCGTVLARFRCQIRL